jgi:hypothetical protein
MSSKKKAQQVKILDDDTGPKLLAKALVDISAAAKQLLESPLDEKALVLLIQHRIPQDRRPTKRQVADVLHAASTLRKWVRK